MGVDRKTIDAVLDAEERPSKHVISGTCPICGCVPGLGGRDLTLEERAGMLDAGFKLATNVFGEDIASGPQDGGNFNDALSKYCRAGHPKTNRQTWHQRVLSE